MPAPSGTQWGAVFGSGSNQGQLGIAITSYSSDTLTTVTAEVWYRTKYSCYDSANSFWVDWDNYADTTPLGSISINHPVDYGSGWSTSNQTKIGSWTTSFIRENFNQIGYFSARFAGIEAGGGSGSVVVSFSVPARPSYTISYNPNGGSGAPSSQIKYHDRALTLSNVIPTRVGCTFLGWATTSGAASAQYQPGGDFTLNQHTVLYAVWRRNVVTLTYDANEGTIGENDSKIVTKSYNYGDLIGAMEVPEREYYKFIEWNTDRYGGGQKLTENTMITQNVTVYAQWELNTAAYVRDEGGYKVGVVYIKDEQQKEGVIYVRDDGTYKQGVV